MPRRNVSSRKRASSCRWRKRQSGNKRAIYVRPMLWIDQLGQDTRYALALLKRDRAFTFVAALALALGIAATTSLITVVNAVILRRLPIADPDRLVAITMRDPRNRQLAMSAPDFDDWQRASRSFSGMTIMLPVAFSVSDHNHLPEQFFGPYTSTNLFLSLIHISE